MERLYRSLLNIILRLENIKFKVPEQSLKIIILNANQIKLNENDLIILYKLLKDEEIKLNNDEKKPKNKKDNVIETNMPKDHQNKGFLDRIISWFSQKLN